MQNVLATLTLIGTVVMALPGLFWCVLFSFLGSGAHAARNKQLLQVEGLLGFVIGGLVGMVFTKLGMLICKYGVSVPLEWGEMWAVCFLLAFLSNDLLGGAETVGSEIRTKPIPFLLDFVTNFLTKLLDGIKSIKRNDSSPS